MDGSVRTCAMTGVLRMRAVRIKEQKILGCNPKKGKQTNFKCVIKFAKIDLEWIELETARTIWH